MKHRPLILAALAGALGAITLAGCSSEPAPAAASAACALPDTDQLVLVYCRSGNRSKQAAQALADQGYTNVVEFGGIKDWPYEIE